MPDKNSIVIVQGAQFGSEAKGAVAHALCKRLGVKWVCRTGSINAGHSVVHEGRKIAFQQIPTGAVLDDVNVVIGPGAYVNPGIFIKEVEIANCSDRTYVDRQCGVHLNEYTAEATQERRNLKIGATGKGCAEATIHKIKDRGVGKTLLLREHWDHHEHGNLITCDTSKILNDAYDAGERILLEGTQGFLLDLHTGPYPFVTSRQTLAASWVSESGLSPALNYEVVLVIRTYPIRVAGNSGPMPYEISWPVLARRMNARLEKCGKEPLVAEKSIRAFEVQLAHAEADLRHLSENERGLVAATEALKRLSDQDAWQVMELFETTTVTKRLRRIAELDLDQLKLTVKKERPTYGVLTFLNYVFPELMNLIDSAGLHEEALAYVRNIEDKTGCPIRYVTTGPCAEHMLEVPVHNASNRQEGKKEVKLVLPSTDFLYKLAMKRSEEIKSGFDQDETETSEG